jgi:DNA transposition AAA+ family ATPase
MKEEIVTTENITTLKAAFQRLCDQRQDIPRMLLLHGFAGAGKTTATGRIAISSGSVFLRCSPVWTPSGLLDDLSEQLRVTGGRRNQERLRRIVDIFDNSKRALFLDDCDQLFTCNEPLRLFETLRYIHDEANIPMVLAGQERIESKLRRLGEQHMRRFSEFVEFKALSLDDAAEIALTRCEVEVGQDLISHLHREAEGSCGRIVLALNNIEKLGVEQGLSSVSLEVWKQSGRRLFLSKN